jgi:hypothetical protein
MNFRFYAVQEEDEWEIITADWWRTAFISVPWTYVPSDVTKGKSLPQQFRGSLFAGLSQCTSQNIYSDDVICKFSENDTLNPELVGVCGAMAAVTSYEDDVGFSYSTCPTIEPHELDLFTRVDLSIDIDENDLLTGRQRWKELVDDLMNGEIFDNANTDNDLTLSSMDLSSSDGSIDSFPMPSTPKAKHIFTDIEVKVSSPNGSNIDDSGFDNPDFFPLGKSLNAAASSFVPTFCSQSYEAVNFPPLVDASKSSSPTLSFATFTFPTLNSSSQPQPTIRLKKDEEGFFTEVQKESSNPVGKAAELLPPFLQESSPHRNRPRKSRTREIVDRLRSTTSLDGRTTTTQFPLSNGIELSQKYASHSSSPLLRDGSLMMPRLSVSEDGDRRSGLSTPSEDDGWVSQPNTLSPRHNKATRTRETRELFLALTRRRTDSLSSENLKALLDSTYDSSNEFPLPNVSTPPSPSPQTPPPLTFNDGWIESNNLPLSKSQKKSKSSSRESHRRKKSSTHKSSSSRASLSVPSNASHIPPVSSASACFPLPLSPRHRRPIISPHIAEQPQAIPYFFSAVGPPVPYTAFMHFPAFPISIPMHGHTGLPINGVCNMPYGTSPALINRRAGSVMPTYRG